MRICKACNDYKMGGVVQEAQNIIYGLLNSSHAIQSSFVYELCFARVAGNQPNDESTWDNGS